MSSFEGSNSQEEDEANKKEKKIEYELLREDYPNYDLSFKIIVIGNSGKKKIFNYNNN